MNVEVKLEVSAKDFWEIILNSIKQDVGEDVEIYSGLTFEKKLPTTLAGTVTAKAVISEFTDSSYCVDFITSKSTVHLAYKTVETEDGIMVSYSEEETFNKTIDKWNAKIVMAFYKKSRTKRLTMKLKSIERHIKGEK